MYPHFIEVHTADDNEPVCINIDKIAMIYPNPDKDETGSFVSFTGAGSYQNVTESYEELKAILQKAGTQIDTGDPRLDTSKPLSWDALTRADMIGEPVWNSTARKWMLLIDSANDNTWIELISYSGEHEKWIEHDAQRRPLYRMKLGRSKE